jgi:tetratricopeptide (TPR) repeat protein/DNA-binding winged helix-turn-helix (wHTH) protein
MKDSDQHIYRFADVEVDPAQGCLRRNGQEQHLRQQTFQVLLLLLEQRERLVTKDELIESVWRGAAVTDNALVQCITDIRRALGDDPRQPHLIKTIPKVGYRFIGAVEEELRNGAATLRTKEVTTVEIEYEEENDDQETRRWRASETREQRDAETAPAPPAVRRLAPSLRRPVVRTAALAVSLVAVLGLAGYVGYRFKRPATEVTLPRVAGRQTIAVMYFENRSGSAELDWLREGLADMLIANLSRSKKLAVLSRQQLAVLLERGGQRGSGSLRLEDALEIARRTQAEVFALGSFARLGERVRLDVQLHDSRDGHLLTTESLLAEKADQLLTQVDLLSLKLAAYLGAAPVGTEAQTGVAAQMTSNLDAWRYYSLALEQAQMFQFAEAIALLEKAIALDSQFAMAWARIGYVYAVKWLEYDKGRPYLDKALSLSGRLSEKDRLFVTAWAAIAGKNSAQAIEVYREIVARFPLETEAYERLGLAFYRQGRWEESLPVVRQGLVTDPERKELYNILGYLCLRLGRRDEGVAAFQRYIQLAPNDPNAWDGLGSLQQWFGDYEQALTAYHRALALNPELHNAIIHLSNLYVWQGRYAAALEQYQRYVQVARSDAQRARGYSCQAWVWLRKGDLAQAEVASAQEKKYAGNGLVWTPVELALRRGEQAAAIRLAEPHFTSAEYERYKEGGFLRIHYYLRGTFTLKTGRTSEALEHFREAIRYQAAEWNIDSFEDCLANAYLELGRDDEAIAEYERILKINPRYPLAHYHLGQAYERQGEPDKARAAYERFLQIWQDADADIPEVIAARQRLAQ